MKTRIIIFTALAFAFIPGVYSQATFTKCAIPNEEISFRNDLEKYVMNFSHNIQRDKSLDSLAEIRVKYFLSVLQETSKQPGTSLCAILGNNKKGNDRKEAKIPHGARGHSRYFGDQSFFKEPAGCRYPEWSQSIPSKSIRVNAEIFTQAAFVFTAESDNGVENAVTEYVKKYRLEYTKKYIINSYLNSQHHKSAIEKYGDGKYGTCTKVLVRKEWDNVLRVWSYEMIMFNLVVFSDPY